MEASTLPTTGNADWAEHVTAAISRQRERLREFLAAQQERLQGAEVELAAHLQELAGELAQERDDSRQAKDDIARRSEDLSRQIETLEALRLEFDTRQTEWERLQQRTVEQQEALLEQVRRHQEELDQRHAELRQRQERAETAGKLVAAEQRTLEAARGRATADLEQLAALRTRLEAQRAELSARAEQLAAREAETAAQRRRVARELKAQRAAQREDLERLRAALPPPEAADRGALQQELDAVRRREKDLAAELETLRAEREQLPAAQRRERESAAEVESLRAECERLSQTIAQAAAAATSAAGDAADQEDFHRRYEMSLEDLRDLKARNAELQQQLAAAKAAGPAAAPQKGGVLNWEAEKQRILAALESDSATADRPAKEERLKVDEVVRRTDQLLADKEREIGELKNVLDQQSNNLGAVAVGAAALGDLLDKDAFVREERENLKRIQDEWRGKIRQAEIDISMERATIARERAHLEERLRALESRAATAAEKPDDADKEGKPVRGRWLARLGLKDINEGGGKK